MDKVRKTCVEILVRCENNGYSNLLIKKALDDPLFVLQDRQLISAIVYGTLERRRMLDALLQPYLKKPIEKLDAPVREILRSGLYQCRYMDGIPAYAAVHAAVDLTRAFRLSSASGMVNAVLRRAAAADEKALSFDDEIQRLAVQYSVSDEIAAMLYQNYPQECEAILQGFYCPSPVVLRANLLRTDEKRLCEALQQENFQAIPLALPGAVQVLSGGDVVHTRAFQQGLFHVQGYTSQLAVRALAPAPGSTVLDLCAAPGGKSVTLAQTMKNRGTLICGEKQANRLPLIEAQLQRCGINCAEVRCMDATVYHRELPQADAVLCDVPCSGTGVIGKKPDIRYKNLKNTDELVRTQLAILENGAQYLRKGGQLVYSTCSLDKRENREVVKSFLSMHPDFAPQKIDGYESFTQNNDFFVTFLPLEGKIDGFFIAKLSKV